MVSPVPIHKSHFLTFNPGWIVAPLFLQIFTKILWHVIPQYNTELSLDKGGPVQTLQKWNKKTRGYILQNYKHGIGASLDRNQIRCEINITVLTLFG